MVKGPLPPLSAPLVAALLLLLGPVDVHKLTSVRNAPSSAIFSLFMYLNLVLFAVKIEGRAALFKKFLET
jgi:hypothetical protein